MYVCNHVEQVAASWSEYSDRNKDCNFEKLFTGQNRQILNEKKSLVEKYESPA